MSTTIQYTVDADGIAILSLDVPGRSMNVLTPELIADLKECVEKLAGDENVKGAVITSAKSAFMAGADLKDLVTAFDHGLTVEEGYEQSQALSQVFRQLETCGKPVAAAINGVALGGGLELCLACHYRVLSDDPKARVGLPEVTIGLFSHVRQSSCDKFFLSFTYFKVGVHDFCIRCLNHILVFVHHLYVLM